MTKPVRPFLSNADLMEHALKLERMAAELLRTADAMSGRVPSVHAGQDGTLLSTQEAARLSGHTVRYVTQAMRRGELHGIQATPRAHWRVRRSCLEAWIARRECEHQVSRDS